MLTARRKADRAKMVAAIVAIATEFGASFEVKNEGENSIRPRRAQVFVRTERDLGCAFDFDGESYQPDVFVNPWNIGLRSDACLSTRFPGAVNKYHFRKSTTVIHGFDALCAHVRQVLEIARDGSCFDAERERAHVEKNGTWQEQQARFDAWRTEMLAATNA